jgi:hypothetical protein
MLIPKGSDDGVKHPGLLGVGTLSIVWYKQTTRFGNWICFRPQGGFIDTCSVGLVRKM